MNKRMLSRESKVSLISHSIIGTGLLALLIIASFYDLKISHALSNGNSFFGALFVSLGELPAYFMLPIAGVIIYYGTVESRRKTVIIKVISLLFIFGAYLVWCLIGSRHGKVPHSLPMYIVYSLMFTALSLWIGHLVGGVRLSRFTRWAMFAMLVVVVTFALTWVIKVIWGRMRYRDMLVVQDFSGFTPWYLPQGHRNGDFTSFPSGHTAHACNIFAVCMLVDYSPRFKRFRGFVYGGGLLFVVLTAMSRIVYNAHYLSDVIVGGSLSYMVYYLLRKVVFGNSKSLSLVESIGNDASNNPSEVDSGCCEADSVEINNVSVS